MTARRPMLIALCGAPGSGKSTVQRHLATRYAVQSVDDGDILRRFTAELLGYPLVDCLTQEGKRKPVLVDGVQRDVRWTLGEMGEALERSFGDLVIPNWAIRKTLESHHGPFAAARAEGYSFGSVRKRQPWAYRQAGGVVVEVVRETAEGSAYAFDLYDQAAVDFTIPNHGSLDDLVETLERALPDIIREARSRAFRHHTGAQAA